MIQRLCSLSTFFRSSAVRTRNLYEIAKNENTAVLAFSSVFEICWAEFTSSLIETTLVSWKALDMYLKDKEGVKEKEYFNFLTSHLHLVLLSYLADVITIFSRFQRKLQSNSITLLDMGDHVKTVKDQLKKLKQDPLLGGWLKTFNEQLVVQSDGDDENIVLSGQERRAAKPRRNQHHNLFVSETSFQNTLDLIAINAKVLYKKNCITIPRRRAVFAKLGRRTRNAFREKFYHVSAQSKIIAKRTVQLAVCNNCKKSFRGKCTASIQRICTNCN